MLDFISNDYNPKNNNPVRVGSIEDNFLKIEPVPGSGFINYLLVTKIESVPDSFVYSKFHYLFFSTRSVLDFSRKELHRKYNNPVRVGFVICIFCTFKRKNCTGSIHTNLFAIRNCSKIQRSKINIKLPERGISFYCRFNQFHGT